MTDRSPYGPLSAAVALSMVGTALALLVSGCRTAGVSGSPAPPSMLPTSAPPAAFTPPGATIDSPDAMTALTLKEAARRAVANNEEIALLKAQLEVAVQQARATGALRDPELRLSRGWDEGERSRYLDNPDGTLTGPLGTRFDDGNTYRVGVRFFPPNLWTHGRERTRSGAAVEAARADLLAARTRVAAEASVLFVEVWYRVKDARLLKQLMDVSESASSATRRSADRGQATGPQAIASERRYLAALSDMDEALRRRDEARRELAVMTGVPMERMQLVVGQDQPGVEDTGLLGLDPDIAQARALGNRFDLASCFWRKREAQSAALAARAERWPWLNHVQVTYGWQDLDIREHDQGYVADGVASPSYLSQDESDEWRVDAAFNLPIFGWLDGEEDVLESEYKLARIREEETTKRVYRDVRDAVAALRSIAERRTLYAEETAPLIKRMQETIDSMRNSTALDPEETARTEMQLIEARRLKPEIDYEYWLAVIRLQQALGDSPAGR